MFCRVGLKMETSEFPSLGRMASVQVLNKITTKESLFVHATSSMSIVLLPLPSDREESKAGASSGVTKWRSFTLTEIPVSKLVKRAWQ